MLRWGVLGTGFISSTVVDAIAASDGSRVDVVAGRDGDRVAAFQADHGIPQGVVGPQPVFEDPDIDAVYVGLPNHVHRTAVVAATAAGKAVLSEKSLTTTMADATALVESVRSHDVFFVEGLMYLAHPLMRRLVDVLEDGRLGTVRSISGRYAADIWQVVNPDGGGTIYNLGCYPVSLLHLVIQTAFGDEAFGQRSVSAVGNRSAHDGNICDAALAVRFDNGVLATLQSTDSFGNATDFSITGDNGVIRFGSNPWLPQAEGNVIMWHPFGADPARPERLVVDGGGDAFYHQVKMVERCVAGGLLEAPRPSPRWNDSLEIMAMLTEWEALCSGTG